MKKTIICLTNSYKYGGRCISGIEIDLDLENHSYSVIRDSFGNPKWMRPISDSENGEISTTVANGINILDILEVDVIEHIPSKAHYENYSYRSIGKVSRIKKSSSKLDNLCDTIHDKIFYNNGKAVSVDVFEKGSYSLMFVKPSSVKLYTDYSKKERGKLRMKITYKGNTYDIPVTDPVFLYDRESRGVEEEELENCYLTLSLGEVYNDWHYKLVAGVVEL